MIPKFAVVGHPNKGKSSIVSTMAEDSSVAISATPGTTVKARNFPLRIDGQTIYELIDTPGFQRPRLVLSWLEANSESASDRADVVKQFVEVHRDDPKFHDEVELLIPILAGAGILYVVDGSKPFGSEYETEMEILRWTGRPRMALINMIGDSDHVEDWRRALDQYFSLVRVFDALHADRAKRLALLRSLGELDQAWQSSINTAVNILESDYQRRQHRALSLIAQLLHFSLTAKQRKYLDEDQQADDIRAELEEKLRNQLRAEEKIAHRDLGALYRHSDAEIAGLKLASLTADIFSEQAENLFGLTKTQLMASGAISGGIAGTGIDVLVGGSSLLAGATIGAVIGSVSALFGGDKLAKTKVLGQTLGVRQLIVGPFKNPNLPWVLLGRALLVLQVLAERNHARRDVIIVNSTASESAMSRVDADLRHRLDRYFSNVRQDASKVDEAALIDRLADVLSRQENDY